jgi:ankyrin repeat protein
MVRLLFGRGANDMCDALYNACRHGRVEIANMLPMTSETLLHGLYGACKHGDIDLVRTLIKRGANDFKTGLLGACIGGHAHIAEIMIQCGAKFSNFEYELACKYGHTDMASTMAHSRTPSNTRLCGACYSGDIDTVKAIMKKNGCDGCDSHDFCCGLDRACDNGHVHIVKLLIEHATPEHLLCACENNHMNVIEVLLKTRVRLINGSSRLTNMKPVELLLDCCKIDRRALRQIEQQYVTLSLYKRTDCLTIDDDIKHFIDYMPWHDVIYSDMFVFKLPYDIKQRLLRTFLNI